MEQSYRQDPFITSYETARTTLDIINQRLRSETRLTWPEADQKQSEVESVLVVGREGGVNRAKTGDTPCSIAHLTAAHDVLALGPLRLLQTAAAAADLHFNKPERLRSTLHTVVAFTWNNVPARIFLNGFNHRPDALETTREFQDFWYFWGDVQQRIYFDNWKLFQGNRVSTNLVEERNGAGWRSTQAPDVEFNVPIEDAAFQMDAAAAKRSASSHGWNRPFQGDKPTSLAPGVDLFSGAWNTTIVRQSDGTVILEAPISERYTHGVIEKAKTRDAGLPVKAVISTSDSWPHTGGVLYAVSVGLPVYILDLNQNLLDKMASAPHRMNPDHLERSRRFDSQKLEDRFGQAGDWQRTEPHGALPATRVFDRATIHGVFSRAPAPLCERHSGAQRRWDALRSRTDE